MKRGIVLNQGKMLNNSSSASGFNKGWQTYNSIANNHKNNFSKEDSPHLTNWVRYRLLDQYLNILINAINEQLDLSEDTKQAFKYNTNRTTASLNEIDEWVYLGAQLVEEMDELSFADLIEMIQSPAHEKSKNMYQQIIETRMIETLKAKQDDFNQMFKQIVEKAILVIDLRDAYQLSLEELKVEETAVQFDAILKSMNIAYLEIEAGDRLDLEKCKTIDVCETNDITKEFLIKEVVQKGITLKCKLHRKASVIVYRWEDELDD